MRSIWKRKWFVILVTAIVILGAGAVGAVAMADPGGGEPEVVSAEPTAGTTLQATGDVAAGEAPGFTEIGTRRAKLHERMERIKERWADARARMTPADRAAFDQLQERAEEQRDVLRKAREDLAGTLKQMRGLVQKYLPPPTTTSAP